MKCWHCNSNIVWNSDYDFEDLGYDGDGIVSILTCSNKKCGAEYECRLPLKKEKEKNINKSVDTK